MSDNIIQLNEDLIKHDLKDLDTIALIGGMGRIRVRGANSTANKNLVSRNPIEIRAVAGRDSYHEAGPRFQA